LNRYSNGKFIFYALLFVNFTVYLKRNKFKSDALTRLSHIIPYRKLQRHKHAECDGLEDANWVFLTGENGELFS